MYLNVKEYGQGTAVILLHGLFGMSDNLTGLARQLSAHWRVIVPDLVNHGKSPHRQRMDFAAMAQDIIQMADEIGIETFHLFGHSMGGKVAMQVAGTWPERVRSLIVADISPVKYGDRHTHILDAMSVIANRTFNQRRDVDSALAEFVEEASLRQFFMKNMAKDESGHWRWRFGLQQLIDAYPDLIEAPGYEHVYNGPCLMIKGELSDYVQAKDRPEIEKRFSNVQLKVVQGAGHWLHAEKPQVFNRLVERFLEEQEPTS